MKQFIEGFVKLSQTGNSFFLTILNFIIFNFIEMCHMYVIH